MDGVENRETRSLNGYTLVEDLMKNRSEFVVRLGFFKHAIRVIERSPVVVSVWRNFDSPMEMFALPGYQRGRSVT